MQQPADQLRRTGRFIVVEDLGAADESAHLCTMQHPTREDSSSRSAHDPIDIQRCPAGSEHKVTVPASFQDR